MSPKAVATRRQLETLITVLYSVRTTNDIIFDQQFRDLEQENEKFNFYVTCTRLSMMPCAMACARGPEMRLAAKSRLYVAPEIVDAEALDSAPLDPKPRHIIPIRTARDHFGVVALSGGYSREEANARLARNKGVVASFSRALTEGLSAQQSDDEFALATAAD